MFCVIKSKELYSFYSAVKLDGCNVKGYAAWSFMDNFEWNTGYAEKFGMHYVNFSDPERPRTPKLSAVFYNQLIKDNGFLEDTTTSPSKGKELGVYRELPYADKFYYGTFPKEFAWGASTSAYQIEGAWNEDGKIYIYIFNPLYIGIILKHLLLCLINVWLYTVSHSGKGESNIDKMTRSDFESTNGNIACNSYQNFKEDVRTLKETQVSDLFESASQHQ